MSDLSIIIPCYNKAQYLHHCIDSILCQTYKYIEIIIVDDCSTDSSLCILREYEKTHKNIHIIQNSNNSGVSVTRNNGAWAASTEYITFIDADDFFYDNCKLEKEMGIVRKQGKNTISYSNIIMVNQLGEKIDMITFPKRISSRQMYIRNMLGVHSLLIRDYIVSREHFLSVGGYRNGCNLFEDLELIINLAKNHTFINTCRCGTAYRQINHGLSDKSQKVLLDARQQLFEYQISKRNIVVRMLYKCVNIVTYSIKNYKLESGKKKL